MSCSNISGSEGRCMVTIKLYASRLKNVAGVGKGISDPYAVVTQLASNPNSLPIVLGKTEVIKNDLNPAWTQEFSLEYQFGVECRINVNLFDEVRKTGKHIPMGSAGFEIGEILGSRGNVKAKKLKPGGVLFVRVNKATREELGSLHVQFKGLRLDKTPGAKSSGLLKKYKPDAFFVVNTLTMSGGLGGSGNKVWHPIYRSEVIKNERNPSWKPFDVSVEKLCLGDKNKAIQIEVYDWHKLGKHTLLGKCQTSLTGILLNADATAQREHGQQMQQQQQERQAGSSDDDDNDTGNDGDVLNATKPGCFVLSHKGKDGNGFLEVRRANVIGGTMGIAIVHNINNNAAANHQAVTSSLPPQKSQPLTSRPAVAMSLPPSMQMTKQPSMSSYPVTVTGSASELPPPIPPPAFDASMGPVYEPTITSTAALDNINYNTTSNVEGVSAGMASLSTSTYPTAHPTSDSARPPLAVTTQQYQHGRQLRPSFLDYISGGLEINLQFAIDFTGSNGDPRKPGTLHYIHPDGQLNDYEKALTAVGSIIARYDADKHFPVYGFGAKYNGQIKHLFRVGGAEELVGIKGVLEGYRSVFSTGLTMSNPTVFAEVIQFASIQAEKKLQENQRIGKQSYCVLLILTDGAVTDVEETVGAINYASSAPLSIVIVGVGNADFSKMKLLDRIHEKYPSSRDIVKFVEFSKFRHDRQALTKETLDEVPSQIVEYFVSKGIMPLPEVSGSTSSLFSEKYATEYNEYEDLDLSLTVLEDGSIQLDNTTQAMWNAQAYGTASGFLQSDPSKIRPSAPPAYDSSSLSGSHHDRGGPYIGSCMPTASQTTQAPTSSYNPYAAYVSAPPHAGVYNPSRAQPPLTPPRTPRNLQPYV